MTDPLTPFDEKTRRLVTRHITSVDQLDLLLLMHEDATRYWSVPAAAAALGVSHDNIRAAADALASRNFLDVRCGEDVLYRFDPATAALKEIADSVARASRDHRRIALRAIFMQSSGDRNRSGRRD